MNKSNRKVEKKSRRLKKYVCLLLLVLAIRLQAQNVEEIRAKWIEAQGGKVLATIKDTTINGTIEFVQMGIMANFTMYQKEPNKMRIDVEVMGVNISQVFDGEKAWFTNPQTGTIEEMPETQRREFARQALGNDSLLYPEKYGITYSFKGKEKINEVDYLVLEQTFNDGQIIYFYLNPTTFLHVKSKGKTINSMTGMPVEAETHFSDYRKIEGTVVPFQMVTYYDGQEFQRMTLQRVIYNSGLEDSLFVLRK
ncbi:MAG: hypothetical protein N3B16_12880 [Candidatus Aminicenantes bacterium]|nr:hypothetical protein [Candidatus Aminicenantes bacterium]